MIDKETELIEKALEGNNRAFEKLIKKYDRRIFNLLLNILKNEADASDAYQNTFIKAHRYLGSFKGNSSFFTWLYRIAINTAYTSYSKRQKTNDVFIEQDFNEMEHIFRTEEAEHETEELDSKEFIKNEVNKLSFQQKSVVYLKSYEGKKFKEIADILSLNIGTVKKYFHRAVQNIKKNISDRP